MGINYYLHKDVCPHCQRCEREIHIGKSSWGWQFSFRGYRNHWEDPENINSYKDWLTYLEKELAIEGNVIKDEDGEEMTLEEWKELIESKRNERNNHTLYCRVAHPDHASKDCWLDEDGNSFTGCEFS